MIKVCGPSSRKCVLAGVIVHVLISHQEFYAIVRLLPSPFPWFKVSRGQPSVGNKEVHITTSTFCQALSGPHSRSLRLTWGRDWHGYASGPGQNAAGKEASLVSCLNSGSTEELQESSEKKAGFPKGGFILLCVLGKDTQSSEDLLGWVVMGKPPSLSLSVSFFSHFKA